MVDNFIHWELDDLSDSKWIKLVADDSFIVTQFQVLKKFNKELTERTEYILDPSKDIVNLDVESHAGIIDFDLSKKKGLQHAQNLLKKCLLKLASIDTSSSSFASMFYKRQVVIKSLFRVFALHETIKYRKALQPKTFSVPQTAMIQCSIATRTNGGDPTKSLWEKWGGPELVQWYNDANTQSENQQQQRALAFIRELAKQPTLYIGNGNDQIQIDAKQLSDSIHSYLNTQSTEQQQTEDERVMALYVLLTIALSSGRPHHIIECLDSLFTTCLKPSPSIIGEVLPIVKQLENFQKHLDVSLPWKNSKKESFSGKQSASSSVEPKTARSMACDGAHIYIHNSRGLFKVGTGYGGTTKGTEYAKATSYRKSEDVYLAYLNGELYAMSSRMEWSTIEVIDTQSLIVKDTICLGIEPDIATAAPATGEKSGPVLCTDGRYLYVIATVVVENDEDTPYRESSEYKAWEVQVQPKEPEVKEPETKESKSEGGDRKNEDKDKHSGDTTDENGNAKTAEVVSSSSSIPVAPPVAVPPPKKKANQEQAKVEEEQEEEEEEVEGNEEEEEEEEEGDSHPSCLSESEEELLAELTAAEFASDLSAQLLPKSLAKMARSTLFSRKSKTSSASKTSAKPSATKITKSEKVIVYVYDPMLQVDTGKTQNYFLHDARNPLLFADDPSDVTIGQVRRQRVIQKRRKMAEQICQAFGYTFRLQDCLRVIYKVGDDANKVSRRLLEGAEKCRIGTVLPLEKCFVLESPTKASKPNELKLNAQILYKSSILATHHQLVFMIPPYCSPWTSEKWMARVYSLAETVSHPIAGSHVTDHRDGISTQGTCCCYDWTNNVIWTAHMQDGISFDEYSNHGHSFVPDFSTTLSERRRRPFVKHDIMDLISPYTDIQTITCVEELDQMAKEHESGSKYSVYIESTRAIGSSSHAAKDHKKKVPALDEVPNTSSILSLCPQVMDIEKPLDLICVIFAHMLRLLNHTSIVPRKYHPELILRQQVSICEHELNKLEDSLKKKKEIAAERTERMRVEQQKKEAECEPSVADDLLKEMAHASSLVRALSIDHSPCVDPGRSSSKEQTKEQTELTAYSSKLEAMSKQLSEAMDKLEEVKKASSLSSFAPFASRFAFCFELEDQTFTFLYQFLDSSYKQLLSYTESPNGEPTIQYQLSFVLLAATKMLAGHLVTLNKELDWEGMKTPKISKLEQICSFLLDQILGCPEDIQQRIGKHIYSELTSLACEALMNAFPLFCATTDKQVNMLMHFMEMSQQNPKYTSLLYGICDWFLERPNLADLLLIASDRKSTSIGSQGEQEEQGTGNNAQKGKTGGGGGEEEEETESESTSKGIQTYDISLFLEKLVLFVLKHKVKEEEQRSDSASSGADPGSDPSASHSTTTTTTEERPVKESGVFQGRASKLGCGAYYVEDSTVFSPPFKLLIAIQKNLILKSGVLVDMDGEVEQIESEAETLIKTSRGKLKSQVLGHMKDLGMKPNEQTQIRQRTQIASTADTNRTDDVSLTPAVRSTVYVAKLMQMCRIVFRTTESILGKYASSGIPDHVESTEEASNRLLLFIVGPLVSCLGADRLLYYSPEFIETLQSKAQRTSSSEPASEESDAQKHRNEDDEVQHWIQFLPDLLSLIRVMDQINRCQPSSHRKLDHQFSQRLLTEFSDEIMFESSHPYPSGSQVFKKSVTIPGANAMAVTFDPLCSTVDAHDQLRFYRDPRMNLPFDADSGPFWGNRKTGEYAFPTRTIILPGSAMTMCFSAKANPKGRSAQTRWGFRCTVRGLVLQSIPRLLDQQANLASVAARMCGILINGQIAMQGYQRYENSVLTNHESGREPSEESTLDTRLAARPPVANRSTPPLRAVSKCIQHDQGLLFSGLEEYTEDSLSKWLKVDENALLVDGVEKTRVAYDRSETDQFLKDFIAGNPCVSGFVDEVESYPFHFMGDMVIKRLPSSVSSQWKRCIRTVMAAMLKHSGIDHDVAQKYSKTARAALTSPVVVSVNDTSILMDRVEAIAMTAKKMQVWMLHMVQRLKQWNSWLEKEPETVPSEAKEMESKTAPEVDTKAETESDSEAKAVVDTTPSPASSLPNQRLGFTYAEFADYFGDQHDAVEDFCTLKRVRFMGPSSSDMEATMLQLFQVMEEEHRQKQKQVTIEGEQQEQQKQIPPYQPYHRIIDHVYSSASMLLRFRSSMDTGSANRTRPVLSCASPLNEEGDTYSDEDDETAEGETLCLSRALSSKTIPHSSQRRFAGFQWPSTAGEATDGLPTLQKTLSADVRPHMRNKALSSHPVPSPSKHHGVQEDQALAKRAEGLQSWISMFQRWKSWQNNEIGGGGHEEDQKGTQSMSVTAGMLSEESLAKGVTRSSYNPLNAVVDLIKTFIHPEALMEVAQRQRKIAMARVLGLSQMEKLLGCVSFDIPLSHTLGTLACALHRDYDLSKEPPVDTARCVVSRSVFDNIWTCNTALKDLVMQKFHCLLQDLLSVLSSSRSTTRASTPADPSKMLSVLSNAESDMDSSDVTSDISSSSLEDRKQPLNVGSVPAKKHSSSKGKEERQYTAVSLPKLLAMKDLLAVSFDPFCDERIFVLQWTLFSHMWNLVSVRNIVDHSDFRRENMWGMLRSHVSRQYKLSVLSENSDKASSGSSSWPTLSVGPNADERKRGVSFANMNQTCKESVWSGMRSMILQMMEWDQDRMRSSCPIYMSTLKIHDRCTDVRELQTYVFNSLISELSSQIHVGIHIICRYRFLAARVASGLVDLVDTPSFSYGGLNLVGVGENIEKLLVFLLLIFDRFADLLRANEFERSCSRLTSSLLLVLSKHREGFTSPRGLQLACKLAVKALPYVSPTSMTMTGQLKLDKLEKVETLSEYLLHEMGSLILKDERSDDYSHYEREDDLSPKEAGYRSKLQEYKKKIDKRVAKRKAKLESAKASDGSSEMKEKEEKTDDEAVEKELSKGPYCVVAHFSTKNKSTTAKSWVKALMDPVTYDVATGIRDSTPPSAEELKKRAAEEFETRKLNRIGGDKVTLTVASGDVQVSENLKCRSKVGFGTVVGDVKVKKGRWFYEVLITSNDLLQIGWATEKFVPSAESGNGVGDDLYSWSYDGCRLKKWHQGPAAYSQVRWKAGDVVGCALDCDKKEMRFYLNDRDLGVAFSGFDVGTGMSPAISISDGESGRFLFHPTDFLVPAAPGFFPLEGDSCGPGSDIPLFQDRVSEILAGIMTKGHCPLIYGDLEYCTSMSRSLCQHGVSVSVAPSKSIRFLLPLEPVVPNHFKLYRYMVQEAKEGYLEPGFEPQFFGGLSTSAIVSEIVDLCRTLLIWRSEAPQNGIYGREWGNQMYNSVEKAMSEKTNGSLNASGSGSSDGTGPAKAVLGSLAVLGGFCEVLRVGAHVMCDMGNNSQIPGIVVDYFQNDDYAHVIFESEAETVGSVRRTKDTRLVHKSTSSSVIAKLSKDKEHSGSSVASDSAMAAKRVHISHLIPVSRQYVDLTHFPLYAGALDTLEGLIQRRTGTQVTAPDAASAPASASAPATASASATNSKDQNIASQSNRSNSNNNSSSPSNASWVRLNASWRAMSALESLVVHTNNIDAVENVEEIFETFGPLLVDVVRDCPLASQFEMCLGELMALDRRWCDLEAGAFDALCQPPFVPSVEHTSGESDAATFPAEVPDDVIFLDGVSSYMDEQQVGTEDDHKMLKFWEKNIIPKIQSYVKGSFKDYEMVYFFESLRQPLRVGNGAAAIDIAFTLCAGHVPVGVTYPMDDKDFDIVAIDEINVGDYLLVTVGAQNSDCWEIHSGMHRTAGRVGRVKAINPRSELVLLQFISPDRACVFEYWYYVETLKFPTCPPQFSFVDHIYDSESIIKRVERKSLEYCQLLARKALFSLCSRSIPFLRCFMSFAAPAAVGDAVQALGMAGGDKIQAKLVECIFLAISEALHLSSLDYLGEPLRAYEEDVFSLQCNVAYMMNPTKFALEHGALNFPNLARVQSRGLVDTHSFYSTSSQKSPVSAPSPARSVAMIGGPDEGLLVLKRSKSKHDSIRRLSQFFLKHCESLLQEASEFSASQMHHVQLGRRGTPLPASGITGNSLTHIHVQGASSLALLFEIGTKSIPPDANSKPVVYFYSDEDRVNLIKSYVFEERQNKIAPFVVPNSHCWIEVKVPEAVRFLMRVVPVHPNMGLVFWTIEFILADAMLLGGQDELNDWKEAVSLCFSICDMILERFNIVEMCDSPLKESVVRLVAKLISKVHSLVQPQDLPQLAEIPIAEKVLDSLMSLGSGMRSKYVVENLNTSGLYTSSTQLLVDLLITVDSLMMPDKRICKQLDFDSNGETGVEEAAEEEAEAVVEEEIEGWACEICTFINAEAAPGCDMCGSPKPRFPVAKPEPEPTSVPSAAIESEEMIAKANQMFHDMSGLVGVMKYLSNVNTSGNHSVSDGALDSSSDDAQLDEEEQEAEEKEEEEQEREEAAADQEQVDIVERPEYGAAKRLMDSAWNDLHKDKVESRLYILENIPTGEIESVRSVVERAIRSVSGGIQVKRSDMFLTVNESKPRIKAPEPLVEVKMEEKKIEVVERPWKGDSLSPPALDTNGILYYLGTKGETEPWQNPHNSGIVTVTASSLCEDSNPASAVVGRQVVRCVTEALENQWFQIKFNGFEVNPTHYIIRHYSSYATETLRGWRLEGSVDGKEWKTLRLHENDKSLNAKGQLAVFALPSVDTYYTWFRIYMTSPNSNSHWYLALSGFELYGSVRGKDLIPIPIPDPEPTNIAAVVQVCSCDPEVQKNIVDRLTGYVVDTSKKNRSTSTLYPPLTELTITPVSDVLAAAADGSDHPLHHIYNEYLCSRLLSTSQSLPLVEDLAASEDQTINVDEDPSLTPEFVSCLTTLFGCSYTDSSVPVHVLDQVFAKAASTDQRPEALLLESLSAMADEKDYVDMEVVEAMLAALLKDDVMDSQCAVTKAQEEVEEWALKDLIAFLKSNGVDTSAMLEKHECVVACARIKCRDYSTWAHTLWIWSWLQANGVDINLNQQFVPDREIAIAEQNVWMKQDPVRLMEFLERVGFKYGASNLLCIEPSYVMIDATDRESFPCFDGPQFTQSSLRLCFQFLKRFNLLVLKLVPLIDLSRASDMFSVAGLLKATKSYLFKGVKMEFFQSILDSTAVPTVPPRITVDRMKVKNMKDRGERINFVRDTNFGSAFSQLKGVSQFALRPVKPNGTEPFLVFEVVFKGEQVVGEGGPWRQFFTDVGLELMDTDLPCPLFVPSPNRVSKLGGNRDKLVLSPAIHSSNHLEQLEFLGMLFGCCVRTGVRLALNLPSFVWKPLVNQSLDISDLSGIDHQTVQITKLIRECDENSFNEIMPDERFLVKLSDGKEEVELKDGGRYIKVTYENRIEYVHLMLNARFNEHKRHIQAIRRGISKVIPLQLLTLLSWKDLEIMVCGRPEIDVDMLKRHTTYSKGVSVDDPHIEMFWDVLHSLNQEDRRRFIRFAWAQDRLPATDDEMIRTRTRFMIKPSHYKNPDKALPRADTCFFNLELPAYSNADIMRERIMYAISSTMTMNADEDVEDIHGRSGRS